MEEVILTYTEDLLKKAVRSFWWRTIGPVFIAVLVLLLIATIYFISNGERSWIVGVLSSAIGIGILFPAILYINHYRNTLEKFKELGGTDSTLRLNSDSFEIESSIGKSSLNWSNVKELWQFSEYWLVFLSKAQFFTLPVSCLSPQAQELIKNRIKEAGGKIA